VLLIDLLELVTHEQRSGPIVKGEYCLAAQERSYRKWFRPDRDCGRDTADDLEHGRTRWRCGGRRRARCFL
jgi:hypothetical protein